MRKRRVWAPLTRSLVYLGMVLILIYCLAPFYWMVATALRLPSMGRSTDLIPNPVSLDNLRAVFGPNNNFLRALLNSVIVAGTTTILVTLFGTLAAYALARLSFPGRRVVLFAIIATSMFPVITLLVPLLKLFSGGYAWLPLHWINTYQAMIVPSMSFCLPLTIWTLTAFLRQLPPELEQAALVDGCNRLQTLFRIVLPLAAPGVFTTAIITFIAAWNEFMIALTMVNDSNLNTATVAISKFTGSYGYDTPYGTIMAAGVVVTVPIILLVLVFQRRIVEGLAAGGVK